MTSEPLNQYTEICRDAIKSSSAKLGKIFENLLLEILLLYMAIQRKINFTQMERYGIHYEQTYGTNSPAAGLSASSGFSSFFLFPGISVTLVIWMMLNRKHKLSFLQRHPCRVRKPCAHTAQDSKSSFVSVMPSSIPNLRIVRQGTRIS